MASLQGRERKEECWVYLNNANILNTIFVWKKQQVIEGQKEENFNGISQTYVEIWRFVLISFKKKI